MRKLSESGTTYVEVALIIFILVVALVVLFHYV